MMTMKMMTHVAGCAIALAVLTAGSLSAQAPQAPNAPQERPLPPNPGQVKITVLVSHFQGEKKTANLPYAFFTAVGQSTSMRAGSMIPVPSVVTKDGQPSVASFSYQSVGVDIDSGVDALSGGMYRVRLSVSDSWLSDGTNPANRPGTPSTVAAAAPVIQRWQFNNNLVLRDGQTLQYTTATDKVTGEVVKIDVTLDVVK